MKHIQTFTEFLNDEVNLNQTRLGTLEQRLTTVSNYIKQSELFKKNCVDIRPQGSYAHKTIIKPKPNKEFDVDLLVYLHEFSDWEPKDYINNLRDLFKNDGTYKDIVELKTRCVRLDYARDFHIDLVPCIEFAGKYFILNRIENKREETDGDGYANWLDNKNKIVKSNQLIKVIRLAKFLRDVKGNFSAKSILLTTMLGNQINVVENIDDFKDVPTSLKTVFNRLNYFLQSHPTMPIVKNPVLDSEDFCRHWNQDKYSNFRDKFKLYTEKINSAFEEINPSESIKKWQEIFNDNFGRSREASASKVTSTIKEEPTKPWKAN